MDRILFKQLEVWKQNPKRKPLILMGARQVGKTTLLKQFGAAQYTNYIYLNFELMPTLKDLFKSSLMPKTLLQAIQLEMNAEITIGETLLIFDEIQECPEALNSLKYFCESTPEYHICAAGSLLGVKLVHTQGFPVGKVNFLHLYPLTFYEFLQAIGEQNLNTYITNLTRIEPLPDNLHAKLLNYFKVFLYTGGMPEVIAEYRDSGNFTRVRDIHLEIIQAYTLDFAKHAPKEHLIPINLVWNSIPSQISKENKKFMYSLIRKSARAKEFESALQWLHEAGLIYKIYNITTPKIPLDAYAIFDFFKIYMLDVGLLGAMVDLSPKAILHGEQLFQEFKGALVENYVAQALSAQNSKLYYWTSEGKAELDFLFQYETEILPLEIKSGASEKKKSLRVYAEKYKPSLLIRGSTMNLKKDGDILNCPLYMIGGLHHLLSYATTSML
jgi:hypothetical protein